MPHVVLISHEWKTRALLRAELLETGLEVEAYEDPEDARQAVERIYPPPQLLIADLAGTLDPNVAVQQLAAWTAQVRVWIIASRSVLSEDALVGHGFERVLFRPIDLGRLAAEIQRALA